jgi:putative transposase
MARLPRLILPGHPHLLTQEARAGQVVFLDDEDRRHYLGALLESSRTCAVTLHAYALLEDRVMLLATPATADALGRFMQRVGRRYAGEFNRRHAHAGSLWAGRYRVALVDPRSAVLACMRFVEQAPQRAGLVADAAQWPWSSAAQHLGQALQGSLTVRHAAYWQLGNTPFAREAVYGQQLAEPLTEREVQALEAALRGGWPIGTEAFCATVADTARRPVRPGARGRPRRVANRVA